jgi:mono/diheme cytochrome c family protein
VTGEQGSVKAWVLAFFLTAGLGLGAIIGIGCLVGANTCPGSSPPRQTGTDGATLFLANCAVCHGMRGEGDRGPSLITGPAASYTVDELVAKIARGKPLAGMPRFKTTLSSEQIRAVAEYIVSLRGAA